ncbi:MAG: hypothetical protein KDD55_05435 [Bdellovibrionales bacterium]|nr:hypothetical protein [Bdellovibrionales bacterium]
MGAHDQRTLTALTALIRGVSHRVRTPLSVVSNDLSYFKTLIDPEECERSIVRCREISEILRDAARCGSYSLDLSPCVIEEFVTKVLTPSLGEVEVSGTVERELAVDKRLTEKALSCIPILFEKFGEGPSFLSAVRVVISDDDLELHFEGSVRADYINRSVERNRCDSFTEYFCVVLDTDSYLPPILDAVVWAHEGSVLIEIETCASVTIRYPLVKE